MKNLLTVTFSFLTLGATTVFAASDAPEPTQQLSTVTAPSAVSVGSAEIKALIDSEKYSEALKVIQSADKKEESAEMQNLKGFALRKSGKPKEAISAYKKALKLMPNFPQAKEYLAVAYLQIKKIKEAKEIYAELSALSPEYAKMLHSEAEKMKISLK